MFETILVADKSPIFRQAIAKILIDSGVEKQKIAFVESDDDVMAFLEFTPTDLLILGQPHQDTSCDNLLASLAGAKTLPVFTLSSKTSFTDTNKAIVTLTGQLTEKAILEGLFRLTQQSIFQTRLTSFDKPSEKMMLPTGKGKILIVDDEPTNIDVAMGHLKAHYKIIAAKSGQQALDIAHKNYQSIDVILLDIMMPGIDGFEVCKQLKSHQATKHIPVIFLSAKSEIDDVVKGLNLGAVDYIIKPFQPQILLARVKTQYQLANQAKALMAQVHTLEENVELRESIDQLTRHDLKGPLARVLFEANKINDNKIAQDIRSATTQVLDMINSSLDVYKIEQGNYPLKPTTVDLLNVVNNAVKGTSIIADEKNVSVSIETIGNNHNAYAEELLCIAIFNNVIKNAIEAAPDYSNVEITLESSPRHIQVHSLNKGAMPIELRDNLFEKFSSSNHIKGSGFGTYSAKIMTEVQNGTIGFEIIDDNSTRFTITLPNGE